MGSVRIDRVEIDNYLTHQGYLRADARLTRSGVFLYLNPDGSVRREFRPDSEVFDQVSMDTLKLVTVTDDHPPVLLDSANNGDFAVGKVGENIAKDGRWIRATVQIDDVNAQEKVRSGKVELSAGYLVDYDATPGVTPDGIAYDGIQSNIRYNHLSLVDIGRASEGSERAALKLDAALQIEESVTPKETRPMTEKVKINGVHFDLETPCVEALQAERDAVQAKIDGADARADAAEAKEAKAQARLDDTSGFAKAVSVRVDLEKKAAEVLESEDFAGRSNRQLKEDVLASLCDGVDFSEKSDAYVDGRFDHAFETKNDEAHKKAQKIAEDARHDAPKDSRSLVMDANKRYNDRVANRKEAR